VAEVGRPAVHDEVPGGYTRADSNVQYVLMYTADNGATWKHMQDDTRRPRRPPAGRPARGRRGRRADETFRWATPPGRFPAGTYRVRIEAYRTAALLHYSFHEERIYINR